MFLIVQMEMICQSIHFLLDHHPLQVMIQQFLQLHYFHIMIYFYHIFDLKIAVNLENSFYMPRYGKSSIRCQRFPRFITKPLRTKQLKDLMLSMSLGRQKILNSGSERQNSTQKLMPQSTQSSRNFKHTRKPITSEANSC